MSLAAARFLSLLFAALALAPALAHLVELPNKIGLGAEDYRTVQQNYRGWALLGIVIYGALLSSLALAIIVRRRRAEFAPAAIAFLCLAGTQAIFWTFTFPANQQTMNWTVLPENWMALRAQWEYSHAASALLNLAALIALMVACCRPSPSPGLRPAIARIWRGRTASARADEYQAYLYEVGIKPLEKKALGVQLFREDRARETEFVTVSYWESVEAMSRFAGREPRRIHHLPRDAEFLIELPQGVQVLEIVSGNIAVGTPSA